MSLLTLILSLLIVVGCAKPQSAVENQPVQTDQSQGPRETTTPCSVQMDLSRLCLTWSWEKRPTPQEYGSFVFKTFRLNLYDQTPIETNLDSHPKVILWMPSMGHGSVPTQVTQIDTGTYRVTQVFFTMPGDWEIRFHVTQDQEIIDHATISINF